MLVIIICQTVITENSCAFSIISNLHIYGSRLKYILGSGKFLLFGHAPMKSKHLWFILCLTSFTFYQLTAHLIASMDCPIYIFIQYWFSTIKHSVTC
jgi:hypothetical protein